MYVIGVYIYYIYFILSPLTVMICYTISQLQYLYYPNGLWNRSSAIWGRWWLNHSKDPIDPRYFQLGMNRNASIILYWQNVIVTTKCQLRMWTWFAKYLVCILILNIDEYSVHMRTLNQSPHQHFSTKKTAIWKLEPAHWIAGRALCFHLGGRSKMMEMVRPNLGTHMTHMPD
jgi:hypothetical protein